RAFFVHYSGLTESIGDYGTIGSGAAYAELFLRELMFLREDGGVEAGVAANFAVYAVKGAELMDPHVGEKAHVRILRMVAEPQTDAKGKPVTSANGEPAMVRSLQIEPDREAEQFDAQATERIKSILREMGQKMTALVEADDAALE